MVATRARRTSHAQDNRLSLPEPNRMLAHFRENPGEIAGRLKELDTEIDLERAMEALCSGLSIFGLAMAALRGRRWLILPLALQAVSLRNTVQGSSATMDALRRLGLRARSAIDAERKSLHELAGSDPDAGSRKDDDGEDKKAKRPRAGSTKSSA